MRFRDLAYETWQALATNKGRSFLTILGIVIGISAVIAMTALIGGIKNTLFGSLGLDQARQVMIMVNTTRTITQADLDQLVAEVPGYEFVTGSVMGSSQVSTSTKEATAIITGSMPEYFTAVGSKLVQGRFFTSSEEQQGALLAVVDQTTVRTLFGNADAQVVGSTIKVGNDDYTIVGVVESTSLTGSSTDDGGYVYLPLATAQQRVTGGSGVTSITGFAVEGADMDSLQSRTSDWFAARYGITDPDSDIVIMGMQSIITEMQSMITAFQVLMTSVASIALFVGGIGIMNMMLTNVTERIHEIGLRKALGARRTDITRQFLFEAIALCLIGGVVGVLFGYLGAWGLAGIVGIFNSTFSITPTITFSTVAIVAGICIAIGVVFGYYPARRAARLNPVEALRYQ